MKANQNEMDFTQRSMAREAAILGKYSRYFKYIVNLGNQTSITMPMLKDVVPDKKEQALIFREIKVLNFSGVGVEYLCWLSLANIMIEIKRNLKEKCETIGLVDLIKLIIDKAYKEDLTLSTDMCNFLRCFAYSEFFYYYLECERENAPLPFGASLNKDNDEPWPERAPLVEMAKCNSMLSPFFELVYLEKLTNKKYFKRDIIYNLINKIYELHLE